MVSRRRRPPPLPILPLLKFTSPDTHTHILCVAGPAYELFVKDENKVGVYKQRILAEARKHAAD